MPECDASAARSAVSGALVAAAHAARHDIEPILPRRCRYWRAVPCCDGQSIIADGALDREIGHSGDTLVDKIESIGQPRLA